MDVEISYVFIREQGIYWEDGMSMSYTFSLKYWEKNPKKT